MIQEGHIYVNVRKNSKGHHARVKILKSPSPFGAGHYHEGKVYVGTVGSLDSSTSRDRYIDIMEFHEDVYNAKGALRKSGYVPEGAWDAAQGKTVRARIRIPEGDESLMLYRVEKGGYEVPLEMMERWEAVVELWCLMLAEMQDLVEAQKEAK